MNKTQQIARGWVSYSEANSLKPGSKKYNEMQHAYVNGVACMVGAELPPVVTIYLMTGRDIATLAEYYEQATA